ncbi:MAG: NAD(P)-dependent alcohol dehydrogenase [Chloroflexi bacterium]|nr:NAD(P)-dependent alcohol dehydrogenase [Chloroflexota bacterium]
MKAVVYTEYGSPEVLHLTEIAKPTPQAADILVRIEARSVNFGDITARNFKAIAPRNFNMPFLMWLPARLVFGLRKPRINILGNEFAGVVEAVGADVQQFKPGDRVFGYRGQQMGANAEYLLMPATGVVTHMPANLTYEEAAVIPAGTITALNLLRNMNIQPGQKVLINGASGGIGSAAVQLAKHYGAEVTGVAGTPRLDYVQALGADHVLDYTREDFTKGDTTYDLIFDILGRSTFAAAKRVLAPHGRYLPGSFKMREVRQALWTARRGGQKVIVALAPERQADLERIRELVEAGVIKPIVDRCFPLEQTAAAHRYAESGQKRGSIVVVTTPERVAAA